MRPFVFLFLILLQFCTQPISFKGKDSQRPSAVSFSSIGNQVIQEDSSTITIPFKIDRENFEPQKTVFQTSSSNTSVLEKPTVELDSQTQEYLLNLTPVPNQSGEVLVNIRMNNGFEDIKKEFTVFVEPINDLPVVYANAEVKFQVGQTKPKSLDFSINDVETNAENLSTRLELTQESLFEPGSIIIDPSQKGSSRVIQFTKAPIAPGNAFLKILAQDQDGGIGLMAVHIVVEPAKNQGPSIKGLPKNLRIGSGLKSVPISLEMADDTSTPLGLSLKISSKDTNTLPQKNILVSGEGYKREIVFLAPSDKKGTVKVLFEISDSQITTRQELDLEIY